MNLCRRVLWQLWAATMVIPLISSGASAQLPVCQPPKAGEYLVVVRSPTPETQEKLRQALVDGTNSIVCQYLSETVTRTGSFTQLENANAHAQSMRSQGLAAFVLRSPQAQPLGTGYAVLVEFDRPETATAVRSLLGVNIGLAAFGQRNYLFTLHTSDSTKATATLQRLSDRGFYPIIVDSRKVTVLSTKVP